MKCNNTSAQFEMWSLFPMDFPGSTEVKNSLMADSCRSLTENKKILESNYPSIKKLKKKNSPASAGDTRDEGLIPGLKRSPGVGNGNLPQYFCLKNPMDRGAWRATVHGVAKSQTQPSVHAHLRMHTHTHTHTHSSLV